MPYYSVSEGIINKGIYELLGRLIVPNVWIIIICLGVCALQHQHIHISISSISVDATITAMPSQHCLNDNVC